MRKVIINLYMFFFHPIMFIKFKSNIIIRGKADIKGLKYLKFGSNCRIGRNCRINCYNCFANIEYSPSLKIGDNSYIGDFFTSLITDSLVIENDVTIASHVLITTENHSMDPTSSFCYGKQPLLSKPVHIKEGCWIGEKTVILPGVTIGKKSIVAASSVVTKDIPDYSIAAGNPAKVIKVFDFDSNEWKRC